MVLQETQQGFIGINVFAYWFVPMTNETEDIIATQRTHDFFLGWWVMKPIVNKPVSKCLEFSWFHYGFLSTRMLNPKWFRNYWLFQYWFIFCHGEMDTCYVCRLSFKFNSYYRFVDVLVFGDYPGIVKKRAGTRIPSFSKDESKQV